MVSEKIFENGGRRRMPPDGRRLDGYTISSPCEPDGSGELIIEPFHENISLLHARADLILHWTQSPNPNCWFCHTGAQMLNFLDHWTFGFVVKNITSRLLFFPLDWHSGHFALFRCNKIRTLTETISTYNVLKGGYLVNLSILHMNTEQNLWGLIRRSSKCCLRVQIF